MRDHRFATAVLAGLLALMAVAGRAEDVAADVQGKWERSQETDGVTHRHVKEHKDGKTTYAIIDEKGEVVEGRNSQYEVKMMGLVKLFVFSNIEMTAGPNVGQKMAGPFAYVYRVEGDTFYEVQGVLAQATGEVELLVWKRVKDCAVKGRRSETALWRASTRRRREVAGLALWTRTR